MYSMITMSAIQWVARGAYEFLYADGDVIGYWNGAESRLIVQKGQVSFDDMFLVRVEAIVKAGGDVIARPPEDIENAIAEYLAAIGQRPPMARGTVTKGLLMQILESQYSLMRGGLLVGEVREVLAASSNPDAESDAVNRLLYRMYRAGDLAATKEGGLLRYRPARISQAQRDMVEVAA